MAIVSDGAMSESLNVWLVVANFGEHSVIHQRS
jgi:hypothetical protein